MATNLPDEHPKVGIQKLFEYCAQNKIPIPQTQKITNRGGMFKVRVWVDVPLVGLDEPKQFEREATANKKKEAEDIASQTLLNDLQTWFSENVQPDISQIKKELNELIKNSKCRFKDPVYELMEVEDVCYFQSNVVVEDVVQNNTDYRAIGNGRTKKDAEKDAAFRLVAILKKVLLEMPSTSTEDKVDLLNKKFASNFPEHDLKYLPIVPEDSQTLFHHCKLIVLKDDKPTLTVAIFTNPDEGMAQILCAEMFLRHFDAIRQKLLEGSSKQNGGTWD